MLWPKNLSKKIKTKTKLANLTSFKIGGPAKFFFEPADIKSLQRVLALAWRSGIKVFILGSGSNVLVSDSGVDGLVIRLTAKVFRANHAQGTCIIAGGASKLSQLILFAQKKGLTGLEFLAGIPGTLGGALAGNAGAWDRSIGKLVKQVDVLDYRGIPRIINYKELKFAYRKSNLDKCVIISATLRLQAADRNSIVQKIKDYLLKRSKTQDHRLPNAGCIFKNPGRNLAGALIDKCGLKGKARGGASVSRTHANFILNSHQAKSGDVLALMDLIQKKIKSRFKVKLKPEIKIWK
ncbi:MAG: UDP-N-acetylenolpyruvoylglucosamine reductase [Candidatus Omnitrophica bacterium CG11_big_fil_rev_8_21_14_0_20_41_12]|nr:MAG: UDP-N-acetylenolpyruvoylglucosamine reductase [Candidatus Omnitrophica bacterium CG11_big_fil_rev_8_21_14_0_20_41_12]